MRRSVAWDPSVGGIARLGIVAVVGCSVGCSSECAGPGCSTSYQTARLAWIVGLTDGEERDVVDDATGSYEGSVAQGTDWRSVATAGRALTGQPDADRVVASSVRATAGNLVPLTTWSGDAATGFGRDLVAFDGAAGLDLWVSAPDTDFGKGTVHLFAGTDPSQRQHELGEAAVTLTGATPNDRLGTTLEACGDLAPTDGARELLIGSPWFAQPTRDVPWVGVAPSLAGAVFLIRSYEVDNVRGTFFPWDAGGATWFAPGVGDGLGQAMSCSADLDGDGAVDLLLGAPYADNGRGRLYVLSGSALPPDGSLEGVPYLQGAAEDDWFGSAVTTFVRSEDPFVAVGAPGAEAGTGRVYLFRGADVAGAPRPRSDVVQAEVRAAFSSPSGGGVDRGTHFGRHLTAADLDGDGAEDLVVGTPDAQGPGANDFDTGAVDVWFGGRSWRNQEVTPDARIVGKDPFQQIGRSISTGDLDGDGTTELLVTSRARTN